MPRAGAICGRSGCPHVAEREGLCTVDLAIREAARGSSSARGYGSAHRRHRASARPAVEAGHVICWRCGEPIVPGEAWHLGHDETGAERGPEHASRCNLRAAGLAAHGKPWTPQNGAQGPGGA